MPIPVVPHGWSSEWTEAVAAVVTAVLTLLTTVVAVLVYLEARAIRHTEWFAKTEENWQAFNRLVIEADYSGRWADIIKGRIGWSELNQKDLMFIYSFLNVLVFEFNAKRARLLDRHYAEKSVGDSVLYFRHIWPDLHRHLSGDGWPVNFLQTADAAIAAAELAGKALQNRPKDTVL
jgi:hypothetical protein